MNQRAWVLLVTLCLELVPGRTAAAVATGGKVCSPDGFCWEHPLPQGNTLRALWSGKDGLYAAGDHGTILRWDGLRWSGQCGLAGGATFHAMTGFRGTDGAPDRVFVAGARGTILRFDGKTWQPMQTGTTETLRSLSGTRPDHLFAGGNGGTLLHFDGKAWQPMESGVLQDIRGLWSWGEELAFAVGSFGLQRFDGRAWSHVEEGKRLTRVIRRDGAVKAISSFDGNAIWGSGPSDVYAVGMTIQHFDGKTWSELPVAFHGPLSGVFGNGPDDVFAQGAQEVLHWDGRDWQPLKRWQPDEMRALSSSQRGSVFIAGDHGTVLRFQNGRWDQLAGEDRMTWDLRGAWSGGDDSGFAVGQEGTALRRSGKQWIRTETGTTANLSGVWGSDPQNVFAVSTTGSILHWNGQAWSVMKSGTDKGLYAIWGSGPRDVYAVGESILHFDGRSFSAIKSDPEALLLGIWGSGPRDVYAVGGKGGKDLFRPEKSSIVLHFNGSMWKEIKSGFGEYLRGVWGSGLQQITVVGEQMTARFVGRRWERSEIDKTARLEAIWGSGKTLFATGFELDENLGILLRWDKTGWQPIEALGRPPRLLGLAGSGPRRALAVGERGTVLGWDGTMWNTERSDPLPQLHDLWVAPASSASELEALAVGKRGALVRFYGNTWQVLPSQLDWDLTSIAGSGLSAVFAVGERGLILRYADKRQAWQKMASGVTTPLEGVSVASVDRAFAVGADGVILRYDARGEAWQKMDSGTRERLYGVWSAAGTEPFVVGDHGTILHAVDGGAAWQKMDSGTSETLYGVWGSGPSDVFAVGTGAKLYHFNGQSWKALPPLPIRYRYGETYQHPRLFGRAGVVYVLHRDEPLALWNGKGWQVLDRGTDKQLFGLSGASAESEPLLLVGQDGSLLRK